MALTKITKTGLTGDVIDETKIADNAISEEHLDTTVFTGNTELSAQAADDDILLVYDTSAGAIKKIQASNVGTAAVTITSISPTSVVSGDGTGNYTFTITGKNYAVGTTANLVNSSGTDISFDTLTRNSSTQLTGVIAKSSLSNSGEPYDIKVIGANGTNAILIDQINIDASPAFVTASGSLGTFADDNRTGISLSVNATDPESAGNVTFEIQSGSLPAGLSLTNTAAEGGTAIISGNATAVGSDTTYNFTLRAVDDASNTSSRSFSITIQSPVVAVFNASGTFSVPSGTTSVAEVLVVGGGGGGASQHGGGGGAGGLVYFPCYPVSPGGTITVTVGCGGNGGPANSPSPGGTSPGAPGFTAQDSSFGSPGDPGLGQGGVLTAKGGGGGGGYQGGIGDDGLQGGSGGGAQGGGGSKSGGSATQPTQPSNSGAYGFGNAGGSASTQGGGSGGGGAGASGSPTGGSNGAPGGNGKAYTIADGTTPVYYAGGGGGGNHGGPEVGLGGQGGGGDGGWHPNAPGPDDPDAEAAQANKGGGGGGSGASGYPGGLGGKGIVIVRY